MSDDPSPAFTPAARPHTDHRLVAVLGPTNTGKTHYALERMCGYATGMIGLPLRLLAREIYERMVAIKGVNAVALITGEEKIIPRLPSYFVCTVEAMPLERQVDFLAVDEIQLCGDTERGYVFTDRLLNARGRHETVFLGATTFAPLFRRLFPEAEIVTRDRLSELTYSGSKKLTRLPKRTAIVAFSTETVYAIAELIRRQRGGAAVVMGSLSPKTRNAQVALFQNGEVDFLVATDAIGMGLNMDIDHVAFSALSKFDGKSTRHLTAQEIGQIAGRAGRFTRAGTFGVTGDCHELDADLVHAVENHIFTPLEAAQWRNSVLDFTSLDALLRSLTLPSPRAGLHLSKEALDEKALRLMAGDEEVANKVKNPVSLRILWEACQLPDFRKIGLDEHLKLVSHLFWSRLSPEGAVPEDWFEAQLQSLDKTEGDIDTLSSRLSGVRTLAYIAHRGGWLKRVEHWRDVTRDLEERLSDKLHEALMQRFIDQRTSALLKALGTEDAPRPEVDAQGQVIMEGHVVGTLKGLNFKLSASETIIEDKTLRQAAHRAITPLLTDRLRDLGNTASKTLRIKNGQVLWQDAPVAKIEPGDYFAPQIKLLTEIDHPALIARATKRLTDYVRTISQAQLKGLWKAKQAAEAEGTPPQVRAIAYQLYENGGILRRDDSVKLSPEDKQALKALGVAGHRYAWFLPDILNPKTRHFMQGFGTPEGQRALSLKGMLGLGESHPPVSTHTLSQLDKIMGNGVYQKGAVYVRDADFASLRLDEAARDKLMLALGLVKVPAIMVRVPVKPVAAPVAEEPDVYAWVDATPVEPPVETAEAFVEEERIGWRQRRPEGERPHRERPRHNKPHHGEKGEPGSNAHRGDRKPRHDRAQDRPKPEGAEGEKPRHNRHEKGKKPHPKGERPAPRPEKEPYINPYSPFAILREKLNTR